MDACIFPEEDLNVIPSSITSLQRCYFKTKDVVLISSEDFWLCSTVCSQPGNRSTFLCSRRGLIHEIKTILHTLITHKQSKWKGQMSGCYTRVILVLRTFKKMQQEIFIITGNLKFVNLSNKSWVSKNLRDQSILLRAPLCTKKITHFNHKWNVTLRLQNYRRQDSAWSKYTVTQGYPLFCEMNRKTHTGHFKEALATSA